MLTSPDEQLSLWFRTNQSAVQMYTAAGFTGKGTRKSSHRVASGEGYKQSGKTRIQSMCVVRELTEML